MPTVIAEREDLLVINKPAGLIVHSDGRTKEPSVADWILETYPMLKNVGESWVSPKPAQGLMPGAKRLGTSPQGEVIALPGIVHRLDRSTSGVMLVAKTQNMYEYLKEEFKARRIEKYYRAYVYGHMDSVQGKIVAEIKRTSVAPRRWYAEVCNDADKRAAITEWSLIKNFTDASGEPVAYLDVHPLTGRTHQIRVHLSSIDHAIVADHLYAPDRALLLGFTRVALHAHRISLLLDGVKVTYEAPLPPDFNVR